jgi:putative membrane protein
MTTSGRRTNWAAELDAYLLGGIGAMLLRKAWSDQLVLYIHPRYTPLVVVTGIVLLVLAVAKIWGANSAPTSLRGRAGIYALLLVPVTLGVLIPAVPVGSSLVDAQGLQATGTGYNSVQPVSVGDTTQWTLLDWMYMRYGEQAEQIDGKPVKVVGFVYRDPVQPPDEFTVMRYTLSCCVADRRGVFLPVRWEGASTLQNDQWVEVSGTVEATAVDGITDFVVVDAQVQPVEQPDTPYLYP